MISAADIRRNLQQNINWNPMEKDLEDMTAEQREEAWQLVHEVRQEIEEDEKLGVAKPGANKDVLPDGFGEELVGLDELEEDDPSNKDNFDDEY